MPASFTTLPPELHILIFSHLPWSNQYILALAFPYLSGLFQDPRLRRLRYCDERWETNPTKTPDLHFHRRLDGRGLGRGDQSWSVEVGLHGLLGCEIFLLRFDKDRDVKRRTQLVLLAKESTDSEGDKKDPMVKALHGLWGPLKTIDIDLSLFPEDTQYFHGSSINEDARLAGRRATDTSDLDSQEETNDKKSRDPPQVFDVEISEDLLAKNFTSAYDVVEEYPQILRVRNPIYVRTPREEVDEPTSVFAIGESYWCFYMPWKGPGSTMEEVVSAIEDVMRKEILDRYKGVAGCWVRFDRYKFFARPDPQDKLRSRWKLHLNILIVKE